jgi:dihydrofolate synthase/folylpolyglutamate synthase
MLSYPDSVRFLYSLGNEIRTVKLGLETIDKVLEALGHPELGARFVHVAGTNGKGSTCAMIESALRAGGVRTGLYTSPHLVGPVERIRIGGTPVTQEEFSFAFDRVHQAAERLLAAGEIEHHPTYFETVTAMGFLLFKEKDAERTVLEVGLGGRLDATNVVAPELCVITPIDYDHETWLGRTVEAIAAEKAGILKPLIPVVIARQREDAEAVLLERARELGCAVIRAADHEVRCESRIDGTRMWMDGLEIECPLRGRHQAMNIATAVLALRKLGVADERILKGIGEVRWPGRLEQVADRPAILLDGAHNPAGVRALASYIGEHYRNRRVWLIFGTMRDKSAGEIADTLFPLAEELILTAPDNPRALDPESLRELSGHPRARTAKNLGEAIDSVRGEAAEEDVIFISGSLFLVGEARALLVQ